MARVDRRFVLGGLGAAASGVHALADPVGPAVDVTRLGADPTGAADSTDAFQAAAQTINAAGGGTLIIPAGGYRVGRQRPAADAKGFAFQGEDIIAIKGCGQPVVIQAGGVTLTLNSGLRFGAFDPATGAAFTPERLPFTRRDHAASLGCFLNLEDNADVTVLGMLTLDGAIDRQVLGGPWADTGRQLPATGVRAYNNRALTIIGLRSRRQGLDDIIIGWTGLTGQAPPYPHLLRDVRGIGAGRNGLSWVGGNSLTVEDALFRGAGRGGTLSSAPAAGVDIEAEDSICRGGVFRRLRCLDSAGAGLVADSGDSADCTFEDCLFVGSSSWAAWPNKPRFRFIRCIFVGPLVRVYGDAGHPENAVRFIDCVNTLDPARSPSGRVYPHPSDFTTAKGAVWQGGRVELGGMSGFNAAGGRSGMTWRDTRIAGAGSGPLHIRGVFEGQVAIDYPNGVWDPGGEAVIAGQVDLHARPAGGGATSRRRLHIENQP